MKTIIIKLPKGKFLSEIEPFKSSGIPSNCILHKEVPGCGATESEIRSERNSIIIVPHQPVIKDKVQNHNKYNDATKQILGVLKGVDDYQIETYINSDATYKKILTTPESFFKILRVFANDLDILYSEYFLLFDECERIITDVNYRGKITAPINELANFDNKALVSATPLDFSHPVFSQFDKLIVEPDYDYCKDISVVGTNSVADTLKKQLSMLSKEQPTFVFINSTTSILDIIDFLELRDQSFVYCGEKSVANLAAKKFKRASSELNLKKLDKLVFLTSRYFSALDIKLDYKPNVIMVTDVYTAEHSVLDPTTEIIQIAGRFRNGFDKLIHIANFNPQLPSKTEGEVKSYLNGVFDTHEQVVNLLTRLDTESSSNILKFYLDESPTSDFYTADGIINDFMVDNFHHEHRVRGYYQCFDNLKEAYYLKPLHFNPFFAEEQYWIGDKERVFRKSRISMRDQQKETFRLIDSYKYKPGKYILNYSPDYVRNLRSLFPPLTKIYDLIGYEGMLKADFRQPIMQKYAKLAQEAKEVEILKPLINKEFSDNSERFEPEAKEALIKLFRDAGNTSKPSLSFLSNFFKVTRTTRSKEHVIIIGDKKDLSNLSPLD
jgi:hypothetical protein